MGTVVLRSRAILLSLAWIAASCVEPEVDLQATVVVVGEPRLAVAAFATGPVSPSIGVLGELALVGWSEIVSDPAVIGDPLAMRFVRHLRWFGHDGEPVAPEQLLGPHFGYVETWVRDDAELIAQSWGDPAGGDPFAPESERVFLLRSLPGGIVRPEPVRVAMASAACAACGRLFMHAAAGWAVLPTLRARGRSWFALAYPPSIGGCRHLVNDTRLHAGGTETDLAMPWSWLNPLCDNDTWRPEGLSEGDVLTYWVFTTPADTLGALFLSSRSDGRGGSTGAYYYMHADPDGEGQPFRDPREPVLVAPHRPSFEDGHQPRATALGPRVLAATLSVDTARRCYTLRAFEGDGSGSRETPWQLPCRRDASVAVHYIEMVSISAGALVVYSRRPAPSAEALEDAVIEAVVITPEGRRGSEVIRVTPREARGQPISGAAPLAEGRPVLAAEGDRAVVAWVDARADAPGLYWQRLDVRAHAVEP